MSQEFINAATAGDVAKVKDMLRSDPALAQSRDENGVSVILKSTYYRKKDVVDVLLASGVELSIFEAAATGQTERVRQLLKDDASLANAFASDGFMPLGLATFFGHRDTVAELLKGGANVNAVTRETMKITPLASAAAAHRPDIARLLIESGADVNAQAENGFTPLHEVAARGNLEFARLLFEHKVEINSRTNDGKTPLGFALEHKQQEMVDFLKARGGRE